MAEWIELLTDEVSAEEEEGRALVSKGVGELGKLLDADPEIKGRIADVLSRRLGGAIGPDTWGRLAEALRILLGEDHAFCLLWLLEDYEGERLESLGTSAPPNLTELTRSLLSVWGAEIEHARAIWNELPEDWRQISWLKHFDPARQADVVTLQILKYSGEEFRLEAGCDSLINLAIFLMRTLPGVGTPDSFAEELQEELFQAISESAVFFDAEERLREALEATRKETELVEARSQE